MKQQATYYEPLRLVVAIALALAAMTLAACGSGGGSNIRNDVVALPPPPPPPPPPLPPDTGSGAGDWDYWSGQGYASTRNRLLEQFDRHSPQLVERLGKMRDGAAPGMWSGSRSGQLIVADGNPQTTFTEQGFVAGIDHALAENLVVGAAFGQADAGTDFDRLGGQARMRRPSTVVYGNYWRGSWYATGQLQTTIARMQMQRWIDLGEGGRHAAASEFDLDMLAVHLETGRDYRIGRSRITPFAGLDSTSLRSGAFTEQGDTGFELTAAGSRGGHTAAEVGLRVGRDWRRDNGGWTRLNVAASFRRGVHAANDDIHAAYVGAPDAQFDIPVLLTGLDSRRLGLDLSAGRGDTWRSFLSCDWNQSSNDQYATWILGAEWRF